MNLDFEDGTAAVDATAAIAAVELQVRERYPMIKRLFIEAGSGSAPTAVESAGFDAGARRPAIGGATIVTDSPPHEPNRKSAVEGALGNGP